MSCRGDTEAEEFFQALNEAESCIERFGADFVLHYLSKDLGEEFDKAVIKQALSIIKSR